MIKSHFLKFLSFSLLLLAFTLPKNAVAAKKIGVLVYDDVLTSDVVAPSEVFGVATKKSWFSSYEIILVGVEKDKKIIKTEEGLKLSVDATIYDNLDLDALIVNSAYSMDHLYKNKDLTSFMQKQAKKVKWLSSNCSGAFLYAHAGLLDGYKATTWAGGEAGLQKQFPKVKVIVDQNVVVDRNRVTTNGGIPSYQGALVLLSMMSKPSNAKEVYEAIQLNRLIPWSDVTKFIPKK